jgi:3-oxoacyl-[acyl-carrier protein] reductase
MLESVLITGTAGDIGVATGTAFARAGHRVIGLDRVPSAALEATGLHPPPIIVQGDLAADDTLKRAFALASEDAVLVHVVGIAGGSLDAEVAAEQAGRLPLLNEFRASIEQNLILQYRLLHQAFPSLLPAARARRAASITLVSSINALAGYGLPAYSAAKAGLGGLAVALAGRLGRAGIRINVLALGTVPTAATREQQAATSFEVLEGGTALGRLGTPEQVAATLIAIATEMTHTTGQVLVADGGQLVYRPPAA